MPVGLNLRLYCTPLSGDICQRLEAFLVVTTEHCYVQLLSTWSPLPCNKELSSLFKNANSAEVVKFCFYCISPGSNGSVFVNSVFTGHYRT